MFSEAYPGPDFPLDVRPEEIVRITVFERSLLALSGAATAVCFSMPHVWGVVISAVVFGIVALMILLRPDRVRRRRLRAEHPRLDWAEYRQDRNALPLQLLTWVVIYAMVIVRLFWGPSEGIQLYVTLAVVGVLAAVLIFFLPGLVRHRELRAPWVGGHDQDVEPIPPYSDDPRFLDAPPPVTGTEPPVGGTESPAGGTSTPRSGLE